MIYNFATLDTFYIRLSDAVVACMSIRLAHQEERNERHKPLYHYAVSKFVCSTKLCNIAFELNDGLMDALSVERLRERERERERESEREREVYMRSL